MRFSGLRKICPGLCAEESFSKGHWLLAFCFNVVKARPPTDDHPGAGTLPSARQTAPLPSFLRQPEASGLPWSYDRLTPPTSGPTLANVDCRPKTQLEFKSSHRAYHQLVATLAALRLYYSATFHHWSIRHARRAGH
jgi:hypothetical protein